MGVWIRLDGWHFQQNDRVYFVVLYNSNSSGLISLRSDRTFISHSRTAYTMLMACSELKNVIRSRIHDVLYENGRIKAYRNYVNWVSGCWQYYCESK